MSLAHTHCCLQNAKNNNNSEGDFLPDVNLSNASPHAIIYPRVMTDFTLENTALWKKIRKQALTKQIEIVKIATDTTNISTPLQASIQSISRIETLEPILTNSTFPDFSPSQLLDNIIAGNANYKAITNHIYIVLSFNNLQPLVVEGIFDHVIWNKDRFCVTRED